MYRMEPVVACVSIVELRSNLAELLNRVQYAGDRITVTRNGKPAVAIISHEDLELLEAIEDFFDAREADDAKREALDEGFIPWEEFLKESTP